MKVFTAMMMHETNRFSPIPTNADSFRESTWYTPGDDISESRIRQTLMYGSFMKVFEEEGHEILIGPAYVAQPSGLIARADYEAIRDSILLSLKNAGDVDAVALFLHGAQMAHGYEDCEGDLLRRVRDIVGHDTPIGVLLDLHGNISRQMLESADILIACKEYPHTDYVPRAVELSRILEKTSRKEIAPRMSMSRVPALGTFRTPEEPLRSFVDRIIDMESGEVLSISVMHGFAWSDTEDTSANIIVVTDKNPELGEKIAAELSEECLAVFSEVGTGFRVGVAEALDRASEIDEGLVVIADIADNAGGGAPSDSTFILAELLRRDVQDAALGMMWDPVAVQLATRAGVGARLAMRIGGKTGSFSGPPLDVEAEVMAINTSAVGPESETPDPKVAIQVAGVTIVLNSIREQVFTPAAFSDVGVDVTSKRVVVVKSTQHFHHAFAPIAAKIIYCDTPGCVSADLTAVPLSRIPRPVWPLDEVS